MNIEPKVGDSVAVWYEPLQKIRYGKLLGSLNEPKVCVQFFGSGRNVSVPRECVVGRE